jgi:hypothetical protein
MGIKIKVLSNEQKYILADNIARLFKEFKGDRNDLFGLVINLKDETNHSLKEIFGEEQSSHITNLTIRRVFDSPNVMFTGGFGDIIKAVK